MKIVERNGERRWAFEDKDGEFVKLFEECILGVSATLAKMLLDVLQKSEAKRYSAWREAIEMIHEIDPSMADAYNFDYDPLRKEVRRASVRETVDRVGRLGEEVSKL